jgi:hypothetical protein
MAKEGADRAGAGESVCGGVFGWEAALPEVGEVLAVGRKFVAPGVEGLAKATARGVLPFGFGGEALPCPGGVSCGVGPGDVAAMKAAKAALVTGVRSMAKGARVISRDDKQEIEG